jgi:hypothetical protein
MCFADLVGAEEEDPATFEFAVTETRRALGTVWALTGATIGTGIFGGEAEPVLVQISRRGVTDRLEIHIAHSFTSTKPETIKIAVGFRSWRARAWRQDRC